MVLKLKKNTILAFLSMLLYKIILDLCYWLVISPIFRYAKFVLEVNGAKLVEAYLLLPVIFVLMPKSPKKLSNIMIWMLILVSYVPMLTIFALKDESRVFMYAATFFWLIVFQLVRLPRIRLRSLERSTVIGYALSAFIGMVVFLMLYWRFGFSLNLTIKDVYGIRTQYSRTEVPLAGYFINWQAYILNPVLFLTFTIRKKWLYAGLIVLFQFFLFSTTGLKSFLFSIPFVTFVVWATTRKNVFAYIAAGLVGVILVGMLSYWLVGDILTSSLFTRRTLLVPAHTYFLYYDFFSQNDPVLLSSTRIFRSFLDYPYHLAPPNLIAEASFNLPEMAANTGLVGDAYMNFRHAGLVLWGILLAAVLKLVDACSAGKDIRITTAAVTMLVLSLVNGGLLTNMLTHGLLLSLLVMYLLPKKKTYIAIQS